MTRSLLPDAVLALVAAFVGRPRLATLERLGARGARVFGLDVEDRGVTRAIVIKCFDSPRLFEQERHALANWLEGRRELGGAQVPKLLAADASLRSLICTRLSGASPSSAPPELAALTSISPWNVKTIHRAAGRCLAALHRLPIVDRDPVPLADALAQRHRAWSRSCADALDPRERRVVLDIAPSAALFDGATRVPCHRDFTPDNWLWDGRSLGLVDFEHARLDLGLVDFAKLVVDSWDRRPDLEIAFFEGYGRRLSSRECTQLRSVVMLHGVASVAWGLRHRDAGFVEHGRRALALSEAWSRA
jgi:hypothetical protein